MKKSALKWWVPGIVLVLAVTIWFGISAYVASKAEQELQQFLKVFNLQDKAHWDSLTATPFGKITIKGFTVKDQGNEIQIRRIVLTDVINQPEHQRFQLDVEGLGNGAGYSPISSAHPVFGKLELPPLDFKVFSESDYAKDLSELRFSFVQDQMLSGSYAMRLSQVQAFRTFNDEMKKDSINLFAVLLELQQVRLDHLQLKLENLGFIEFFQAALQKNAENPEAALPGLQSYDFTDSLDIKAALCPMDQYMSHVNDPELACRTLFDFATGRGKTLDLSIAPVEPVTTAVLFQLQRNPSLLSRLNIDIKP